MVLNQVAIILFLFTICCSSFSCRHSIESRPRIGKHNEKLSLHFGMFRRIAPLCSLTFIGFIIAALLFASRDKKSSIDQFHLRQSFGLYITGLFCYFVYEASDQICCTPIFLPWWCLSLFFFYGSWALRPRWKGRKDRCHLWGCFIKKRVCFCRTVSYIIL